MPRERQRIDTERLDVNGDVADGLHAIRMKDSAMMVRDLCECVHRLDRADFVIREHDADDAID